MAVTLSDEPGFALREYLDKAIGPVLHAFLPYVVHLKEVPTGGTGASGSGGAQAGCKVDPAAIGRPLWVAAEGKRAPLRRWRGPPRIEVEEPHPEWRGPKPLARMPLF